MPVFDEDFDVVVAGYGFAGAAAAIEASDRGARVLAPNARLRAAIVPGPPEREPADEDAHGAPPRSPARPLALFQAA